jgi:PadR family transcriptional regulator, regulatory protein PadR
MKVRNRPHSNQTLSVLHAINNAPQDWSYGLEISKATGLKSGSLYPILMRCNERGLLESCWLEPEKPGRPPRHGYRITKAGLAQLQAASEENTSPRLTEARS